MQQNEEIMNDINIMKNSPLFRNLNEIEIKDIMECFQPSIKEYYKNEIIFSEGDFVSYVGIVLTGSLKIVIEDVLGNRSIISEFNKGELFAESLACSGIEYSPFMAITDTGCIIAKLEFQKIFHTCKTSCEHHTKIVENMIKIIASKNLLLNQKIQTLSARSIREKILNYLTFVQNQNRKQTYIEIPYTRDELADYLCVNRSALSRELSHMKEEGILDYNKNKFMMK